jgi:uncharacterized membrane protein
MGVVMRDHLDLYVPSMVGVVAAVTAWFWLSAQLGQRDVSRWRAVPFCLPLLMMAAGYGLFWLGFFSSPTTAVQLHAMKLAITHLVGDYIVWIGGIWLLLCAVLLLPLVTTEPRRA